MTAPASSDPKPARLQLKAFRPRGLAHSLGRLARSVRLPSLKQARPGTILLDEASQLGFR